MTIRDLVRALVRRWPILLIGALVTGAVAFLAVSDRGVYWSRTEVAFLAPSSARYPNSLQTTSGDLIITAGIVAKRIEGPAAVPKFADSSVNLIGEGVRDGWSMRLPDTGGQWATNFASQTIILEVVGPTRESVETRQDELIAEIATQLDALQREQGVDPVNDIISTVTPASAVVNHVIGSRIRAVAMTGVLGMGAVLALVVFLEHRARRRTTAKITSAPRERVTPAGATPPAMAESSASR
ncbi:hypothetical protein [Microbacterium rhizomatis]|uniref:hypothetical protein n=1 Tax=Microbacterium rhizomatis TaxID=1631477 RepID=UPI001B884334|nr:hypothetical protein [Microbacterium rhizomatis]